MASIKHGVSGRTFEFQDTGQSGAELSSALTVFMSTGQVSPGFEFKEVKSQAPTAAQPKKSLFKRGRSALIKGLTTPLIGPGDTPGSKRGKAFLNFLLPETPAGLAADVALAGASFIPGAAAFTGPALLARRGKKVAQAGKAIQKGLSTPGRQFAARTLAPPIASTVTGAATGQDPGQAAFTGAVTSATELLGPVARGVGRISKKLKLGGGLIKQGVEDAKALGTAISKEVPVLKKFFTGQRGDLAAVRSPKQGLKALKDQFQATDDAIVKAFKGETIPLPATARIGGQKGDIFPGEFTENMTPTKALEKLKALKKESRKLNSDFNVREEARKFEGQFRGALGKKGAPLLAQYDKAIKEFSKGRDILTLLKQSKALKKGAQGGFLDVNVLAEFLTDNIERFPPEQFPDIWAMATRGLGPGAADAIKEITFRGIVPRAGAANIKLFNVLTKAGEKTPLKVPGRGQFPASIVGTRLGETLSSNPTGGR